MAEEQKKSALEELEELEKQNAEHMASIRVAAAKSGNAGYMLALLEPIMVGAEKKDSLHFRAQTVRDVRATTVDDAFTGSLCGLTADQVQQLSMADYAAVQEVIAGFHLRRAVGGPAR